MEQYMATMFKFSRSRGLAIDITQHASWSNKTDTVQGKEI